MTEFTGIGSVETGNPEGGNGEAEKGSTASAAATDSTSQQQQGQQPAQAADNLDWAKAKGWVAEDGSVKTEEVLKGYQNLEKAMGSKVSIPDEKSKPEDVEAFHKKLGWPGSVDGYEFARPENLPENLPYDEGFATEFKQWANDLKLPKAMAQALHDKYIERFVKDVGDFDSSRMELAKKAHGDLVKDWGAPGSETYSKNIDAATRALRSDPKLAGLEQELKASGLLTKEGNFTSPQIANLLAGYGRQFQNDSFVGNATGAGAKGNPFSKGDPAYSTSKQVEIIRSDPARARQLAEAAGLGRDIIEAIPLP